MKKTLYLSVCVCSLFALTGCLGGTEDTLSPYNSIDPSQGLSVEESWVVEQGDPSSGQVAQAIDFFQSLFVYQSQKSLQYIPDSTRNGQDVQQNMQAHSFLSPEGESMDIQVEYSYGHAEDVLHYTINGEKKEFVFPYTRSNKEQLQAEECSNESLFSSILCYMPRIDALFGPYDNVFGSGNQLVYTVSSYQGMSSQHVVDLPSQQPLPTIDGLSFLFALDMPSGDHALLAAMRGADSLYDELFILRNGEKYVLWDQAYEMFSYDGEWIVAAGIDYMTMNADIFVYNVLTEEEDVLRDVFVGLKSEFTIQDGILYAYYVDVSFVEEEENYYIQAIDLDSKDTLWLVKLSDSL